MDTQILSCRTFVRHFSELPSERPRFVALLDCKRETIALTEMKSSAPAPKPLPLDLAKARAGSPWVTKVRAVAGQSCQSAPATAARNLPSAAAGLIPRLARVKISTPRPDSSFGYTGSVAMRRAARPPRASSPFPPAARMRASAGAPSSALPGNYRFALPCEIQSLAFRHFLRGAELCAARARIAVSFVDGGLDRLLGENAKYASARLILERMLHEAIFK
jgi:hypothetical protein